MSLTHYELVSALATYTDNWKDGGLPIIDAAQAADLLKWS